MSTAAHTPAGLIDADNNSHFYTEDSKVKSETMDTRSSAHSFSNRDAHVRLLMNKREHEFLTIEKLGLFIGTWNTNGKAASEDLTPWFANAVQKPPALIVLGFQELDLSKEALLLFTDSVREGEWKAACDKAVNGISRDVKYKQVQLVRMVGVMLIVYASQSISDHVKGVATGTVPTGIMGFMDFERRLLGNKGGVAIRLDVHNTSICFITSHLAAHMEQKERRNQDFKDIRERMVFTSPQLDPNSNNLTISSHDLVFWLGDLNYRINDIPIEKVKLLIKDSNWQPLIKRDQLIGEKAVKNVFEDYTESPLTFAPTYKYDAGTNEYDTSEKMRVPAWTDRILYKGSYIEPLSYDAHMELMLSDHKPVSHTFNAGVKVINDVKYHSVYEDVMKILDKLENEFLPQVKLSKLELNFGEVRFKEPKMLTLEISNTGQVPADFLFIPKLNESSYCKGWMSIKPYTDCVLPGEVATLTITVYVDEQTASQLNSGSDNIDDILVLHLEGGKDFFVTINGQYTLSSFGCSLETLIRLPLTIREMPRQKIFDMAKTPADELSAENSIQSIQASKDSPMPVPKELFFLLDNINSQGKDVRDLFQQRGLHQEIVAIRESLDTSLAGQLPGSIHSIAEALLLFLDSLQEPVIPFSLYDDTLSAAADRSASINIVSRLPPTHKKVFEYLIEFMLELLKFSDSNYLDANILGSVFGPVLIRTNDTKFHTKGDKQLLEQRKSMFISNFLHNGVAPPST